MRCDHLTSQTSPFALKLYDTESFASFHYYTITDRYLGANQSNAIHTQTTMKINAVSEMRKQLTGKKGRIESEYLWKKTSNKVNYLCLVVISCYFQE